MKTYAAYPIAGLTIALALTCVSAGLAQPAVQTPPAPLKDKSLEELMALEVASVTGAARHEQRVTEAPSSVTVITAADIKTFGWRTLSDVLRSVRGFYVTNDRNYNYVGVRGFGRPTDYNNRILVIIDGHRLNDNVYDAVGVGTDGAIDLDLVERIEVIRGPGSALYGTSAFFGVLNVVTKRGGAIGGVEAAVEAGTLETVGGRLTLGHSWSDGRDLMVSVSGLGRGGIDELYFPEFDTPETSNGLVSNMDGDHGGSIFVSSRVGQLSLQGAFSSRTKDIPTASWGTRFGDDRYTTDDSRGWFDASYERTVSGTTLVARGFADHMGYSGEYPYDEGADAYYHDSASGSWLGGELTASRRIGRHQLIGGTEYRYNSRQAQKNWDHVGEVYIDDVRRSHQAGLFVQDEIAFGQHFTAIVGGRADWVHSGARSFSPRAGMVYRTDADTAVKLLYGEAFRAANVYEMYYTEDNSRANPDLRPERIRTFEAVFEQYVRGRVRFTASAFLTRIHDLIDQTHDGQVVHVNRGSVSSRGIEGEVEYRSTAGVLSRGSLVVQTTRDGETSEALSNAPGWLGTLQLAVPLGTRAVMAALDASAVGARTTRSGRELEAFTLANAIVTWEPRGTSLLLQGGVYNLFDTTYEHPVGTEFVQDAIAQDGRTAALRVIVRF
jgi:outer membrane receptor protein involved in Fe transport